MKGAGLENFVEMGWRQIVISQVQHWCRGPLHHTQGVDIGSLMTTVSVSRYKILNPHLQRLMLAGYLGGYFFRLRL